MVHALRETHRVLKPDGLLVDLRPASIHRRVGITRGEDRKFRWTMRENFDDDHAADRAVDHVAREGLFRAEGRKRISCYRMMDTIGEFKEWLTDFIQKGTFESHDWLVRRLERALSVESGKAGIVVSAPLVLRALRKL